MMIMVDYDADCHSLWSCPQLLSVFYCYVEVVIYSCSKFLSPPPSDTFITGGGLDNTENRREIYEVTYIFWFLERH